MNWEMIGWLAIAASVIVIVASFFVGKQEVRTATEQAIGSGENGRFMIHTMLEYSIAIL